MRKPRAIIYDDEIFVLNMLKEFFVMRGYEVLSFSSGSDICPVYRDGEDSCRHGEPCADVMITDFAMPGVNGVELLEFQAQRGCKLDIRNKSIMSGYIDDGSRQRIQALGCGFIQKPFTLYALTEWLDACERRFDLRGQLASRRREDRFDSHREVTFSISSTGQVYSGIAVNMSPSGLCLRIPAPLKREDTIRLHADKSHTSQQASVRWVRQIDSNAYIAGVRCA